MTTIIRTTALLLALSASAAWAQVFRGEVVAITDGDTLKVKRDGKSVRVRLNGIDCPERRQPFATVAKQFTSHLAYRKQVRVEVKEVDRHGRLIADVILPDGRVLSQEIVEAGLAWWYRKYSDDEKLHSLEIQAMKSRRGLWSQPDPVAPWEYRKVKNPKRTMAR